MQDNSVAIDLNFKRSVEANVLPKARSATSLRDTDLTAESCLQIFKSQIYSRHLDLIARRLKVENLAFYTIGSSGHEGNASVAHAFRVTDMAFLHYRSGAFFIERMRQVAGSDPVGDILRSLLAAKTDPISAGRHKVFGSYSGYVPPQTSTIASHCPKAVGMAISLNRAKELQRKTRYPEDSVVLASFGDASLNHASTQTALNACSWITKQSYPMPLVWICEDNGIGISVPTPKGWVVESVKARPQINYIAVDGLNFLDVYRGAKQAEQIARKKKQPVFLHMTCVRLMGHAGSDIETQYKTETDIAATEANDPLLHSARILIEEGLMTVSEIIALYNDIESEVAKLASKLLAEPKLGSAEEIMASLLPPSLNLPECNVALQEVRKKTFSTHWQYLQKPRNMAQQINYALTDLMLQYDNILLFGEDVGKKGGVYRVTADLQERFTQRRVFDTLLDETTILGTAIGLAHNGFLPIPEIQFLAYFHNAEDQLRGEAATLSFFSSGQYTNPMVIRIAGMAYQKGFGGHFHNDNSLAVFRDIPGVIIALPSCGDEAAKMLRECVYQAYHHQRIVVFIEPIALYMTKDLVHVGDNLMLAPYSDPNERIHLGEVGVYGKNEKIAIITYGNGTYLSRIAREKLGKEYQIACKIIDLRWIAPLPVDAMLDALQGVTSVLIVDECRQTGSVSEAIITAMVERLPICPKIRRVVAKDSFIPLGSAWQYVLPSVDDIIQGICDFKK